MKGVGGPRNWQRVVYLPARRCRFSEARAIPSSPLRAGRRVACQYRELPPLEAAALTNPAGAVAGCEWAEERGIERAVESSIHPAQRSAYVVSLLCPFLRSLLTVTLRAGRRV